MSDLNLNLDALAALEQDGTPGPWQVHDHVIVETTWGDLHLDVAGTSFSDTDTHSSQDRVNAALIAALRNAAPDLIAAARTSDPSWADCIHGVENGCESYRCGSSCSQRFDRMHPCRACLSREVYRLRTELAAARAAAVREARDEIKTMLDGFKQRGRHTRARWAVEWLGTIANRAEQVQR